MEIIIGKTAGFCFGVANAVNKTEEELDKGKEVYCLGELVHNNQVKKDLQSKGLKIIDNIEDAKDNLILRSHGAEKTVYDLAKKNNLKTVDLTCPKVLKIHDIAMEYEKKGYYIFLIGKKTHPEINATISYCGENSEIIENIEQVEKALNNFKESKIEKLLIIVQTTFSIEKFNSITKHIKEEIKNDKNIILEIKNTICDATKLRQNETEKLSKNVDMMIIIGGRHSSNTNKLYDISKGNCKNCILIEEVSELNSEEIKKFNKIGIMAGASTPKKSIDAVVEMIKKIC